MTPKYYHSRTPPRPVSNRVRCPVCDQEVYSLAGIHPQCAVRRCDPPRAKNQGLKTPPEAEPLSLTIEASKTAIIPAPPAAIGLFDPHWKPA